MDFDRVPTVSVSNCRSPVFSLLRRSAMLVLMSSIKPSRGPLTAMDVGGSVMVRTGIFFTPMISALSSPSTMSAVFPESTSSAIA